MSLLLAALLPLLVQAMTAPTACEDYRITHYAADDYPGLTADGSTSTRGALGRGEAIAAGSYNLPFGTRVAIDGEGVYQIRDRGHLGARHIDVLVPTHAEAVARGSYVAEVCILGVETDAEAEP